MTLDSGSTDSSRPMALVMTLRNRLLRAWSSVNYAGADLLGDDGVVLRKPKKSSVAEGVRRDCRRHWR